MTEYLITLHGCDDDTLFHAELTPAQAAVVRRLAEVSQEASASDCQPTLHIDCYRDLHDIDKVVSIDDRIPFLPTADGDLASVRVPRAVDRGAGLGNRRVGCGRRVRAESVAHPVSALAGEDRPRRWRDERTEHGADALGDAAGAGAPA